MSPLSTLAAAWLLTYALHSTLLLGAAAVLTWRWVRGESWRETLWKAALIGGVVTATAQVLTDYSSLAGRVAVAGVTQAPPPPAMDGLPLTAGGATSPDIPPPVEPAPGTPVPAAQAEDDGGALIAPPAESAVRPARPSLASLAVFAWAAMAAALLARLAMRQARLRRMLRGRGVLADGELDRVVAEMRRNTGLWRPVRLTACEAAPTPLALGGGEICVPPRFLRDLDPEQQRTALAHELAHLARRDPAWHFAVGILESVFFFQPLNRVARLRLRESAEFLCDEWAARQTGSPLGLARCLAEVASWVAPGRSPIPAGTMAMAEGGSPLVQRVQRLTTWRGEGPQGSGAMRIAAAVALVGAVAAAAPAVASSDGTARTEGTASAASAASAASTPSNPSAPSAASTASSAGAPDTAALAAMDTSVQGLTIIRHPNPSQPLPQRWSWAADEIARRGMQRAWVAWSLPTTLSPGPTWIQDDSEEGRTLVNRLVGAPADHSMMLFTVASDGQMEHAVGHSAVVDLSRHPVIWLGPARGDESFAQLRRMADRLADPTLRTRLVEAVGLHDAAGVVPYLAAVLGRDGSNGVRRQAASVLSWHKTDEALDALRTAVERDGSDDVHHKAVEAIDQMGTAQSAALLERLAVQGRTARIRRQAAQALGQRPSGRGVETLAAVALNERRAEVARQAAESMADYPAEVAGPQLVRIAWEHENSRVARQAAESLGRLPAEWAPALDSIARRHPNADVAKQAVEALGGYSDAVAGRYLRRIARSHPDPRVRQEAREHLPGGGRSEADPDPEPGRDPDPDGGFEIAIADLEPALRSLGVLHAPENNLGARR